MEISIPVIFHEDNSRGPFLPVNRPVSSSPGTTGSTLLQCKREVNGWMSVRLKEQEERVSFRLHVLIFFFLFCMTYVNRRWGEKLSTGTGVYSHVGVDFQHHVLVLVEKEDAEGRHLLWDAARLRDAWDDTHCPHYALDCGVVRGLQRLKERDKEEKKTLKKWIQKRIFYNICIAKFHYQNQSF